MAKAIPGRRLIAAGPCGAMACEVKIMPHRRVLARARSVRTQPAASSGRWKRSVQQHKGGSTNR